MKIRKRVLIPLSVLALLLLLSQCSLKMRVSDSDARKDFKEHGFDLKMITATIDGREMHYAQTGIDTAPTLFFVHGSPGSWSAFEDYLRDTQLNAKYRLISIDRPGFGFIGFGRGISVTEQCGYIGNLIKSLQNGKHFYIIGHSLGGPICVKLAANYQQYINGVVLLAASVDPNEEDPEKWRPILRTPPVRWFVPGAFRPSNDELWFFKKDVVTMPADLQSITCPVTIIQGLKDPLVPPGNAYYAQKQLTRSKKVKLITIPDANHFIPWTRYKLIKDMLMEAIDSM